MPLTRIQDEAFTFICDFILQNNYPPILAEIQEVMGINNPGQVYGILSALEKKGYIKKKKGMHRGIFLV
jgi:SOS-response transcriptional repressor LexA